MSFDPSQAPNSNLFSFFPTLSPSGPTATPFTQSSSSITPLARQAIPQGPVFPALTPTFQPLSHASMGFPSTPSHSSSQELAPSFSVPFTNSLHPSIQLPSPQEAPSSFQFLLSSLSSSLSTPSLETAPSPSSIGPAPTHLPPLLSNPVQSSPALSDDPPIIQTMRAWANSIVAGGFTLIEYPPHSQNLIYAYSPQAALFWATVAECKTQTRNWIFYPQKFPDFLLFSAPLATPLSQQTRFALIKEIRNQLLALIHKNPSYFDVIPAKDGSKYFVCKKTNQLVMRCDSMNNLQSISLEPLLLSLLNQAS